MKDIDSVEFYKELYMNEISRKENLNSKLSMQIGLITVLGGITVFEIENLYQNTKVNFVLQIEFIVLTIIILGINIINLYKANHNKKYRYLDNPKNVKKAFQDIEKYYTDYYEYYKTENESLDSLLKRKKEEKLIEMYIECAEENSKVNDIRYEENMRFIKAFIISLVVICIIGIYCIIVKKPIDINILKGGI